MIKIGETTLKIIKDSREEDTLEATMRSGLIEVSSSVPHGKSRGEREAYLINPQEALLNFEKIKPIILKQEFESLIDFDNFLLKLDGTDNKKNLGGNLTLTLSQTFARLASRIKGLELWQYLREVLLKLSPDLKEKLNKVIPPYFLFNLINGGQHAPYGPKIQEYLLVPKIDNPRVSLELAEIFFAGLKEYFLKEYGENKNLHRFTRQNLVSRSARNKFGDEGGLLIPACAGRPENNYEKPLEIFSQIRKELKLEKDIGFSLDAAASTFYDQYTKKYSLVFNQSLSSEELLDIYKKLIQKYQLISLEDPFEENDWEAWKMLAKNWKFPPAQAGKIKNCFIIGDDLTVTNSQLLAKAAEQKAISGIIIKPTQIGTITETLKTVALAHQKQIKIIVSHRSAETLDDFIADLTVASGAWGLKAGAPQPEERMVKYRRVIQIMTHAE